MKHKNITKVTLIGRVNVGKSTLFNKISHSLRAMTYDYEGVTRDPLIDLCFWKDAVFRLVDTAGLPREYDRQSKKKEQRLHTSFFQKTLDEAETADLLVLVVDGQTGLTPDDYLLISRLRTLNKPIIVAVNKSDIKDSNYTLHEVAAAGFDHAVMISGAHSKGIEDLLDLIFPYCTKNNSLIKEDEKISITLLGKPNVGKSSLLNLLSGKERAVVSDIAGTTREGIRDEIVFYNQNIEVIDTAGVRRSRSINETLEHMMVGNTFDMVKKSHIVLLVLDASADDIVDQELKLAHYVFDELYKSLIIVWNKVDLVDCELNKKIDVIEEKYEYFFRKCLSIRISCKTGKNVGKIMPLVTQAWQQYTTQLDGYTLFTLFKARLAKTPLMHKKNLILLKNIHQVNNKPPTFYLEVNEPLWIEASQRSFFENILRAEYNLKGTPVKWVIRKK